MFRKNLIDFTIGADPEFMMLDAKGDVVSANWLCEEMREPANIHELGADGCGSTFEARPNPSPSPIQIVNNLHNIFIGHCARHPKLLNYRWQAGSHHAGFPLGGHIHFGVSGRRISPITGSELLSQYVGALSILIEDKEEGKKRRARDYGGLSDHRVQTYGFEYRTPSSWLTSPYVAAGMLCLAKTVIWEAINNPKAEFNNYVVNSDFKNMNVDKVSDKFPAIWKDITRMHLYQEYKIYIDVLYHLATNRLKWYAKDGTMNSTWGLVDLSSSIPSGFALDTIWGQITNSDEFKVAQKEQEEKEKASAAAKKKAQEEAAKLAAERLVQNPHPLAQEILSRDFMSYSSPVYPTRGLWDNTFGNNTYGYGAPSFEDITTD